jgi:aryl-alcohol dehydrogenase-like predicted oxidoreductase
MRIVGQGVWGPPADREEVLRVLRRLPELGVDFIDTADSYGPAISEDLIREALHPYERMTVATKAGFLRTGPNRWHTEGRPEYLWQQLFLSRERLGVEQIDLWQLHRIDPDTPARDQFELLRRAKDEGLVRHVGLSEVSVDDIKAAREVVEIATVQNRYNLADRASEDVLDYCEQEGIGFIPWFPLAAGKLAEPGGAVAEAAAAHDATPGQVALAWLLQRSPVMLPIPGTSSVAHLEENVAAADLRLGDEELERLDAASQ